MCDMISAMDQQKNKYEVHCFDEFNSKITVIIMAYNKVEAQERVLTNHPSFEVTAVLSQDELKEISDKS